MRNEILIVAVLGIAAAGCSKSVPVVQSPDGRIAVTLDRNDSSLSYRVDVDGHPLILPSGLGFVADGLVSAPDARMSLVFAEADTVWHQPWGENKRDTRPLQRDGDDTCRLCAYHDPSRACV